MGKFDLGKNFSNGFGDDTFSGSGLSNFVYFLIIGVIEDVLGKGKLSKAEFNLNYLLHDALKSFAFLIKVNGWTNNGSTSSP